MIEFEYKNRGCSTAIKWFEGQMQLVNLFCATHVEGEVMSITSVKTEVVQLVEVVLKPV